MPDPAPLALTLAGGGARAAYQVGVLQELAARRPDLRIPILSGVSAGAINIAGLAAHRGTFPEAVGWLRDAWASLHPADVYRVRTVRLALSMAERAARMVAGGAEMRARTPALLDMAPLRWFLARGVDFGALAGNIASGRLRAAAFTATAYGSGATVTFVQGAPDIVPWRRARRIAVRTTLTLDHLMASAAIPIVFPPVQIEGRWYGDGSVRTRAPLAPAIRLGAGRVLAIASDVGPAGRTLVRESGEVPSLARAMVLCFEAVFDDALDADAERVERVNGLLACLAPGRAAPDGLRPVSLCVLRPSQDLTTLVHDSAERLPRTMRAIVRALAHDAHGAGPLLSYLLFDPEYTDRLVALGRADTAAAWPRLAAFLDGGGGG